jgi:hypothetical protein
MAPKLYDFFWQWPLVGDQARLDFQIRHLNVLNKPTPGIEAVILYPALVTPHIVAKKVGGQNKDEGVEMLLLVKEDKKLTPDYVNLQLKAWEGLNPRRKSYPRPLCAVDRLKPYRDVIKVKSLGKLMSGKIYKTVVWGDQGGAPEAYRFEGMVDKRAVDLYQAKGFTEVYAVSIRMKSIIDALKNKQGEKTWYDNEWFNEPRSCMGHNQDFIVNWAIKNNDSNQYEGRYGYAIGAKDVQVGDVDPENPVQAYHPVFYFDDLTYANISHLADIHLSSRQQLLAKSPARVIEHSDFQPIGKMVNICSKNTKCILNEFGNDPKVHIVVISGDLVDFIPNVYKGIDGNPCIKEIWDTVDVNPKNFKKYYHDYVDFISIYSLLIDFYRDHQKNRPVYAVTGNHDCYYEPFGITPRIYAPNYTRANEGIPADHNLTFYEAILCFGPTFHMLQKRGSSFTPETFKWFYTVLTPFCDFSLRLPKQILVALGWGDNENVVLETLASDQEFGHLPRSEDAVSDLQLKLLNPYLDEKNKPDGKKVILASHFTFASYKEQLSEDKAAQNTWGDSRKQGDIYLKWNTFSFADMGTFYKNRQELYKKNLMEKRNIQCILTGHSHRRGLYTIRNGVFSPPVGYNSVKTDFFVFPDTKGNGGSPTWISWPPKSANKKALKGSFFQEPQEPWIIVSDSGGSVPRRNRLGEFNGFGSDKPSGTKIVFDDNNGAVIDIRAVPAPISEINQKPRFVVALDYVEIMGGTKVFKQFDSDLFTEKDETLRLTSLSFNIKLADDLITKYKVVIDNMTLYCRLPRDMFGLQKGWHKRVFNSISNKHLAKQKWSVSNEGKLITNFCKKGSTAFLSVMFKPESDSPLKDFYDFSTPWNFEIECDRSKGDYKLWGNVKYYYTFARDKWNREIPNHAHRQKHYSEYR